MASNTVLMGACKSKKQLRAESLFRKESRIFIAGKRMTAVGVLAMSGIVLSGCGGAASDAPESETATELYEQALANREQFWHELDDMEKVVGGEWKNTDDRIAQPCSGEMRDDYYYYDGFRERTEPVDDIHAAGDAIRKYWDDIGYSTQQVSYAKDNLIVSAKDAGGWSFTFETNGTAPEKYTTLAADTGCFRGNYRRVLKYEVQWDKDHPQPSPTLSNGPEAPEP